MEQYVFIKKRQWNGKIKIDGGVNVYIVYLPDSEEGGVRSLNTVLDFSKVLDFDDCKPGMQIIDNINIKNIECKILNGRKVNIKIILDENIKLYSNEDIEIVNEIEDIENLEKLEEELCINSLLGFGETVSYAKETMTIDNVDNLAEILKVDISIINKENKISYNKVLCKAEALVKIMYLTDDGRIKVIENRIPVMGFIDMPNVNDTNICNTKYKIKNLIIKPNQVEEHSIYVEIEIELSTYVYEKKKIKVMQDLYTPEAKLEFTSKEIDTRSFVNTVTNTLNFNEKIQLERLMENEVYDVDVVPYIIKQSVANNKVLYEGEVKLNFVYSVNNFSGVDTKEIVLPFNFSMQSDDIDANTNIDTGIEIGLQNFVVTSDESIDIKIDLIFKVSMSNNSKINVIDGVEIDENKNINKYSMVIYFVKPGDSLWKIAKKFASTVSAIAEVNNIEQIDNILVGQQLFIPRYNG